MLESVFNKVTDPRACNTEKETRTQVFSCKVCDIFRNTYFEEHLRLLLYFQYNSHRHYHYHHFHYHCKMHLYRLRFLLTIPLDCNMIPCLFQLNFVFFLLAYIFLVSFQAFRLLRTVKGLRICLRPPDKF